jgi:hypothetical protein
MFRVQSLNKSLRDLRFQGKNAGFHHSANQLSSGVKNLRISNEIDFYKDFYILEYCEIFCRSK